MKGKELIIAVFFSLVMSFSLTAVSQTMNEAGDAFNNAIQAANAGNVDEAIDSYERTIEITEQLGSEGMDLQLKAQQQLANLYLKSGLDNYKSKKFSLAEEELRKSAEYAKKVGDTKTEKTANAYVARVNYSFGLSLLKKDNIDEALNNLNEALKYDPGYYKAYYGLALAYKAKDMPEELKNSVEKMIELGGDDEKYINRTKSVAGKYFLSEGTKALQANNYDKAVEYLNQSLEYGKPEANTYYYLAVVHNARGEYDQTIKVADQGIDLKEDDSSNLYFEKGKAYEAQGNNTKACEAYNMVTQGPNVDLAKYKVETELKCN